MASAEVRGPYWLNHTPGEVRVCGRHGKVMFRYPTDQEALATEHVRRLQKKAKVELREQVAALVGNQQLADKIIRLVREDLTVSA
jgi:hypothetical protein